MADTRSDGADNAPARRAALGTLLSLLLRILSFGCTQWTLRVLDPAALGQASIQLELMLTTILFMSREGFRLALTRVEWKDRSIVNVSWLSVPVVSLVSSLALMRHLQQNTTTSTRDYRFAGILYCVASLIEGCAEPAILTCLERLDVTTRAAAEGVATLSKTFCLVLCLQQPWIAQDWAVTAFGVSQLAYAVVLFLYVYSKTWSTLKWPNFTADKKEEQKQGLVQCYFHRHTCWLALVFTFQGLFKHALTEGDKIVLTQLEDDYHQGVYSMGLHFGGMAARILLQPIEENARLLWSRLAAQPYSFSSRNKDDPLEMSYTVLVKLVMYIGLLFATIAVNYTSVLLKVLAGSKWGNNAEAAHVLSAFCVYTALLALNGTTEAFVYAVAASGKDVGGLSVAHICVGLVFYGLAPFLVSRQGTVGLVAANGVAMVFRSLYSLRFAARFFAERQVQSSSSVAHVGIRLLKKMSPHPAVLLAFMLASGVTKLSLGQLQGVESELGDVGLAKLWLSSAAQHILVGIIFVLGVGTVTFLFERELGHSLRSMFRRKQD